MSIVSILSIKTANAAFNSAAFANVINPIIDTVVKPAIILLFAIAIVVFVYGVIQIMTHPADDDAHKKGRMAMLSGIIGFAIMITAWGIVYLIANTVDSIAR